jgi:1,4-alpha-glucan branching enzyme
MAEHNKDNKKATKPAVKAGMGPVPHEKGTTFRVWAPNAEAVFVTGDFNDWKEDVSPLKHEGDGYWAADVPGAKPGDEYKFIIINGEQKLYRIDPYARQVTNSVGNSVIHSNDFDWGAASEFHSPPWNELVIYELHVGTFNVDSEDHVGNFQRAAQKLPYLQALGVNAVQLMPPMEFPGSRSWGYNPSLPFAVESDYGGHQAFKAFVKAAHEHGIAVILDVVYNHFGPSDLDLWRFDGWSEWDGGGIYLYNDDRGQTPWGHTRPDYGRPEVRQYIRDNALMWRHEFKIDGLRWDATAYIRNVHGNDVDPYNELPEGWGLMQWVNNEMRAVDPNNISIAEDLKNNEWLVKDTGAGGAGFGAQWDASFVHPVRAAIVTNDDAFRDLNAVRDALLARYDGDAFKRVIYTESHDEVANGRARVPEEIWPGNSHHWFAKKRSTLGAVLVFTAPGIPMIFQGQEFLADKWFSDTMPLDWDHAKAFERIIYLYRDLMYLRRNAHGTTRGLTGQNIEVYHVNNEQKVMAFHRWADGGPGDSTVVVVNMSGQTVTDYQIGFPAAGTWRLRFDSHAADYSEDYDGQVSVDVVAGEEAYDGQPASGRTAIGPYTGLIFTLDPA